MSKVFISYGSKNRKVAEGLCTHLEAHGIPCWMAPRDISSGVYAGEITRAIKAADVFIVICSKETRESDHVKNEVNLAVSHAGLIVPYCLDESPFDDDLEYYLSSKQRIISQGNTEKDFQRIESIIREHRGEEAAAATPAPKPPRKRPLLPILCVAALIVAAGVFFWWRGRHAAEPAVDPGLPVDSLTVETPVLSQGQPVVQPQAEQTVAPASKLAKATVTIDPNADTFTGKIVDGYPDGRGIYTFKTRRQIDMHDPQARWADPGEYIEGHWNHGHLVQGTLYRANGKSEFIDLGDYPSVEKDHIFNKCVNP